MRVTVTKFRQELFKLADLALEGEPVEFVHKGVVVHLVPERKASKLARLIGRPMVAPMLIFRRRAGT